MSDDLPALPDGMRLYAIGDVHGCLDLAEQLVGQIRAECAAVGCTAQLIFLGDYIDRGLQSRQTLDYLIALRDEEKTPPVFLLGNHEQVMRGLLLDRDTQLLANWLTFGGRETLQSYGVKSPMHADKPELVIEELIAKVPQAHVDFLQHLQISVTYGDYFFCHAGARPKIPLARQNETDLIWIRDEFLTYKGPFGKMVVHGHSIRPQAEFMPNRIGIDTGAYATGCLTALGLEGTRRWLVQTR